MFSQDPTLKCLIKINAPKFRSCNFPPKYLQTARENMKIRSILLVIGEIYDKTPVRGVIESFEWLKLREQSVTQY